MATPSKEFAKFLHGYALIHASTDVADEISDMTKSPNWAKLEAPLVAILLIDRDERVSDDELEAAFNCDVVCDFTTRIEGMGFI